MTAETFRGSKYKPVLMPMPFGADSDSNYDIPSVVSETDAPSFQDGFPSAFSSPKSNNGQYVTRQQMNGIGNLATRYEFFRRVGGLNTFDADFAIEIGGYPKGVVLDFMYDNKLYKVLSLVDNNKVDFTGAIPTEAQATAGIVQGSVDGYNWLYCNIANQVVKYDEIAEISDFTWIGEAEHHGYSNTTIFDIIPVRHFTAARNGYLSVIGAISSFTTEEVRYYTETGGSSSAANFESGEGGFGIAICTGDNNVYSTKNPPVFFYSRGNFHFGFSVDASNYSWTTMYSSKTVSGSFQVVKDNEYTIYVVNKGANVNGSTLKVLLQ